MDDSKEEGDSIIFQMQMYLHKIRYSCQLNTHQKLTVDILTYHGAEKNVTKLAQRLWELSSSNMESHHGHSENIVALGELLDCKAEM